MDTVPHGVPTDTCISSDELQCSQGAWIKSSVVGLCADYVQEAKATVHTVVADALPPFLAVRLSHLRNPSIGREMAWFSVSSSLETCSLSGKT